MVSQVHHVSHAFRDRVADGLAEELGHVFLYCLVDLPLNDFLWVHAPIAEVFVGQLDKPLEVGFRLVCLQLAA